MSAPFDEIQIEFIPHEKQMYSTCGNWRVVPGVGEKKVLLISISKTGERKSDWLIALHELAESIMCYSKSISPEVVDSYDQHFESNRKEDDNSEPGDHFACPYHSQHSLATAIERIASVAMDVGWLEHDERIANLFEKP